MDVFLLGRTPCFSRWAAGLSRVECRDSCVSILNFTPCDPLCDARTAAQDANTVLGKYGADALRLYLINSPVVAADTLKFREEGVFGVVRDVFLPWCVYPPLIVRSHWLGLWVSHLNTCIKELD